MAEIFFRGRKVGSLDSYLARFVKEIKIKKKRDKLFISSKKLP